MKRQNTIPNQMENTELLYMSREDFSKYINLKSKGVITEGAKAEICFL